MMRIDMIGGLLVIIGVILLVSIYRKMRGADASMNELPPRMNTAPPIQVQQTASVDRPSSTAGTPSLPRRSHSAATQIGASTQVGASAQVRSGETGPRGIRPDQYPVCPIDRQRNALGETQKIFWSAVEGCYHCTHGHKFRSNGQLMGS